MVYACYRSCRHVIPRQYVKVNILDYNYQDRIGLGWGSDPKFLYSRKKSLNSVTTVIYDIILHGIDCDDDVYVVVPSRRRWSLTHYIASV